MVPMPPVLVLIVCRVILGEPDVNSTFTNWRPSQPDMSNGVMHCRRIEQQLYDPNVDQGADEKSFTPFDCHWAALRMGPGYDVERFAKEKDTPAGGNGWRFWRAACPTPIYPDADADGKPDPRQPPIAWKIPECPSSKGVLECEGDTPI